MAAGVVVIVAIASAILMVTSPWSSGTQAQPGGRARLWPAFEMTFSVQDLDPVTGEVIADQTWHLRAESERSWRAEVVRDALDASNVGSWREFREGVHTQYFAALNHTATYKVETPDEIVALSQELDPTLYPRITNPSDQGPAGRWQVNPIAPDSVLTQSEAETPCGDGTSTCAETTRIWWDLTTQREDFLSPLPARSERTVDAKVVHRFIVDSLSIGGAATD